MFRCDRRYDGCDGEFENFVGTKHTPDLILHALAADGTSRRRRGLQEFSAPLLLLTAGTPSRRASSGQVARTEKLRKNYGFGGV